LLISSLHTQFAIAGETESEDEEVRGPDSQSAKPEDERDTPDDNQSDTRKDGQDMPTNNQSDKREHEEDRAWHGRHAIVSKKPESITIDGSRVMES
jgi:hypothetical protein